MFKYLNLLLGLTFMVVAHPAVSAELVEGAIFRLNKTVTDVEATGNSSARFTAAKDSKFKIVDASNPDHLIVRFIAIRDFEARNGTTTQSTVRLDGEYKIAKTIDGVQLAKSVEFSRGGMVSGPLIVPFKYRTDSKSLAGDATVGYYAGYSVEPSLLGTRVPISPFIAGGVSQIAVADGGDTTNETGVTLAIGILIQNWAGVNVGLVFGQDRIGDETWEHEGETWVSFMIGWDL